MRRNNPPLYPLLLGFGGICLLGFFLCLFSSFGHAMFCLIIGSVCTFFGYRQFDAKRKAEREYQAQIEAQIKAHEAERASKEEERLAREWAAYDFSVELSAIPCVEINPIASGKRVRPLDGMPPITLSRVTSRTSVENMFPLVFIDVETTGLSPDTDRIVEVSAIRFDSPFVATACFNTLVNPRRRIPNRAYEIHGISDDDVEFAPFFPEIVPDLAAFVEGANLVGHNILFDLRFLYRAGLDLSEDVRYFDTVQIAKTASPDVLNYKLVTLCNHYGIYRYNAHSALSDCYATAKVLENLLIDMGNIQSS